MSVTNIIRNRGEVLSFDYDGIPYSLPGHGDTTIVPAEVAVHVARTYGEFCQIVHPEAEAALREAAEKKRKPRSVADDVPPAVLEPAPTVALNQETGGATPRTEEQLAAGVPLVPEGTPSNEPKGDPTPAPEPPAAGTGPKKKATAARKRGAKKGK